MTIFTNFSHRFKIIIDYYFSQYNVNTYPQEVVIELTNHCNLACKMCPQKKMKRQKGFMDNELFRKIIDEISGKTELVYLHGTGESLLHKKLFEYSKYAKSKGLYTCLSTNGMLMNSDLSKQLLNCGLDFLIIAIDGGKKETYESIRIKGDFDKLVSNIKSLLQIKKDMGSSTNICLQMIYMDENKDEIQYFKNLFTKSEKQMVDQFRFKPLYKTYALRNKSVKHKKPCFWLWNMMAITWDGTVSLCCMDFDAYYKFGNINKNSISEIWNSEEFCSLRKKHKKINYDSMKLCETCDIPEQGYFNNINILGSLFLNAGQIRKLIPVYEKYVIIPFQSLLNK